MRPVALGLALGVLALAGCDSAGHDHDEGEVITQVSYALTPVGGGAAVTATFTDANRNGVVDAGEVTTLALRAGTTYTGLLSLAGPEGDITGEVVAEKDAHVFVYTPGGPVAPRLAVTRTDVDGAGLPFGRSTQVAVSAGAAVASGGTLRVELVHFGTAAVKATASGVPAATAERDVNVLFPVTVQ